MLNLKAARALGLTFSQSLLLRANDVIHLVAADFVDLTGRLSELREDQREIVAHSRVDGHLIRSRDFH